jgi:hypothetical protein
MRHTLNFGGGFPRNICVVRVCNSLYRAMLCVGRICHLETVRTSSSQEIDFTVAHNHQTVKQDCS